MARTVRSRSSVSRSPRKRALLVGINQYPQPFNPLKGCVNDALMLAKILIDHFGFVPGNDMRLLVDGRATKQAILERLEWLVADAQPGDILVFHYSGHGAQVPDRDGDEIDEVDECLCPVDFNWDDPLLDDDLHKFVERVPEGANFTTILDCCHSGTGTKEIGPRIPSTPKRILPPPDIRFRAVDDIRIDLTLEDRSVTMTNFRDLDVQRFGSSVAERGILVAGCRSDQLSKDAWIDGDYHGALTYSLYQALLELTPGTSYVEWVAAATKILKAKHQIPDQDPQLEAADEFSKWKLFGTEAGVRVLVTPVRAVGTRHVVYVHGICDHPPGFSDSWWEAMRQFVPSISPTNRHEVLWSDLVTSTDRSLDQPLANQANLAQSIKDVLVDRAQRQFMAERLTTARGEPSAEPIGPRAIAGIPGLDCIDDFMKYLLDSSIRDQVIGRFIAVVKPLLDRGDEVEVISHSWGTVVAYEALRRMDAAPLPPGRVRNFFTVGSALSIAPVRRRLEKAEHPHAHKPAVVQRWVNLDARGDIVGGPLRDAFVINEEFLDLDPFGCNRWLPSPACAHSSYFRLGNVAVNEGVFGRFVEG